jgi:hypothetical protein
LQEKQIDRQSKRIPVRQTLRAVYRYVTPLEIAQILQPETISYEILGVSDASKLRDGVAEFEHIGGFDEESGGLGHRAKAHFNLFANENPTPTILWRSLSDRCHPKAGSGYIE